MAVCYHCYDTKLCKCYQFNNYVTLVFTSKRSKIDEYIVFCDHWPIILSLVNGFHY